MLIPGVTSPTNLTGKSYKLALSANGLDFNGEHIIICIQRPQADLKKTMMGSNSMANAVETTAL